MTDTALPEDYRTVLERNGRLRCRVASGSMTPFLRTGDWFEIEPVRDPSSLARFDVIVFLLGGKPFCHFVWHHNHVSPGLCTRSLAAPWENDPPVPYPDVVGRLVGRSLPAWTRLRIILGNLMRGSG